MSYFEFENYISKNFKFSQQIELANQSAKSNVTILISGPSGSGKTSLALSIHRISDQQQFIVFDCSANEKFDNSLNSSQTLIIDNIDMADDQIQKEIFQLLQADEKNRPRVIATVKSDLKGLVQQGIFRQDLYYKISIIHLEVPSLMDRQDDLEDIIDYIVSFTQIMYKKSHMIMTKESLRKIQGWNWDANIRELENVLERAVCLAKDQYIIEKNIIFDQIDNNNSAENIIGMSLSEVEKRLIIQTLQLTSQNRTKAAQVLGISIRTLRNKLNEYRQEGAI